jgi:hypothetical protein
MDVDFMLTDSLEVISSLIKRVVLLIILNCRRCDLNSVHSRRSQKLLKL